MGDIFELLKGYELFIILALIILIVILFITIIVAFSSISRLEKKYRKLMRGVNNKNLEELVTSYLDNIDIAKSKVEQTEKICENLEEKMKNCIQKISVIRYKAFEDVGSDLSFSIALLDEKNDGVILTGIYSRNESTTYAKPIDSGISRYDLSEEEKSVLNKSMSKSI